MHLRESSTYGSGKASVGHASRQRVQVPQCDVSCGASGSSSTSVNRPARKIQLPCRLLISIVFLPNHPRPAARAKSRSSMGAESITARVAPGALGVHEVG